VRKSRENSLEKNLSIVISFVVNISPDFGEEFPCQRQCFWLCKRHGGTFVDYSWWQNSTVVESRRSILASHQSPKVYVINLMNMFKNSKIGWHARASLVARRRVSFASSFSQPPWRSRSIWKAFLSPLIVLSAILDHGEHLERRLLCENSRNEREWLIGENVISVLCAFHERRKSHRFSLSVLSSL
jgi:hypothetical protein